jgi:hypothetical protein
MGEHVRQISHSFYIFLSESPFAKFHSRKKKKQKQRTRHMPNHQATEISVTSLKFDSQEYPTSKFAPGRA